MEWKFIIRFIDNVAAFSALIALFVVCLKFVTARLQWQKIDRLLMKFHKKAAYVLVGGGFIHGVLSLRHFSRLTERVGSGPYIWGTICFLAILCAIYVFHQRKTLGKKNISWLSKHRKYTVVAILACILHIVALKIRW